MTKCAVFYTFINQQNVKNPSYQLFDHFSVKTLPLVTGRGGHSISLRGQDTGTPTVQHGLGTYGDLVGFSARVVNFRYFMPNLVISGQMQAPGQMPVYRGK